MIAGGNYGRHKAPAKDQLRLGGGQGTAHKGHRAGTVGIQDLIGPLGDLPIGLFPGDPLERGRSIS